MATTTPFPFREHSGHQAVETVIEWYESAQGDLDKATSGEDVFYYDGLVDAYFNVLVHLLHVTTEEIDAWLNGAASTPAPAKE